MPVTPPDMRIHQEGEPEIRKVVASRAGRARQQATIHLIPESTPPQLRPIPDGRLAEATVILAEADPAQAEAAIKQPDRPGAHAQLIRDKRQRGVLEDGGGRAHRRRATA